VNNLNAGLLESRFEFPNDLIVNPKKKLPEKIIQFGEGIFLRGFFDWMIDIMNEHDLFNGNAVIIQPRGQSMVDLINSQDGLYTLYLRGIQNGNIVELKRIISSVSRAINLFTDFDSFIKTAENEDLRFVVSNTTEAGIVHFPDDRPSDRPPASYPGKLAVFLYSRFKKFNGDPSKGLVIIPCELNDRNADKLKEIVLRLSDEWKYEKKFIDWIETSNHFLNSLVDRIVTGYPADEIGKLTKELGYSDKLLNTAEVFHSWIIEGDSKFAEELPFAKAGLNVIWTGNITPYRTRKVRILNGAHTMTVLAAYLYGLDTVKQCMDDSLIKAYIEQGLYEEIIPTLDLPEKELIDFAKDVCERFANPFIKHNLLNIALNSASKFRIRVLPSITDYVNKNGKIPQVLTFSLSALIAFYKGTDINGNLLKGRRNTGPDGGNDYKISDDKQVIELFYKIWNQYNSGNIKINELCSDVLSREDIWGLNLNTIPGFTNIITGYLQKIISDGMEASLRKLVES
jgi:tagaturonate reductase